MNTLALKLLGGFDEHISSWILFCCAEEYWDWGSVEGNSTGFTGLHGSAYLGMVEIAVTLLEIGKCDLNATDVAGNTAILWAARKGHGAMVKMLLAQKDIIPDTADRDGRTPLSWVAKSGNKEIVRMLLERQDVNPNTPDKSGCTAV